jgi:hypothetical protein
MKYILPLLVVLSFFFISVEPARARDNSSRYTGKAGTSRMVLIKSDPTKDPGALKVDKYVRSGLPVLAPNPASVDHSANMPPVRDQENRRIVEQ